MLPEVVDAAVIGVPDAAWGERPVAIVVMAADCRFDAAALQEHCRRHLAKFKVPDTFIARDALPRNPSGKLLKRVLRDEYKTAAKPE